MTKNNLIIFTFFNFLAYVVSMLLLTRIYNVGFNEINLFYSYGNKGGEILATGLSLSAFLSGYLLIYFLPGVLLLQKLNKFNAGGLNYIALSNVLSIFIFIIGTTLFKWAFHTELNRIYLLFIIFLVLVILLIKFKNNDKSTVSVPSFRVMEPGIILLIITLVFTLFHSNKIIDGSNPSFSYSERKVLSIPLGEQSDELELFGKANSLKEHVLPYWDLEYANRFGYVFIDPPFYSYISMFAILLFGESFASLSLISISFIFLLFIVLLYQTKEVSSVRILICSLLLLSYYLFMLQIHQQLIYSEYYFVFIIFMAYLNLIKNKYKMFLLFATLATLIKYYAIFFIMVGLVSALLFDKDRHKAVLMAMFQYILILVILILCLAALGKYTGNLNVYWKSFIIEHFRRVDFQNHLVNAYPHLIVADPKFVINQNFYFLKWCLFSTAFTFPVLFLFGKNKNEHFYSFIGISYFLIIFFSQYQYMRYIIPLVPFTALVLSSRIERWSAKSVLLKRFC